MKLFKHLCREDEKAAEESFLQSQKKLDEMVEVFRKGLVAEPRPEDWVEIQTVNGPLRAVPMFVTDERTVRRGDVVEWKFLWPGAETQVACVLVMIPRES